MRNNETIKRDLHFFEKLVGTLMRVYRRSPFHSYRMGKFLAKMLSFFQGSKNDQIIVKEIQGINYELNLKEVIDSSLYYSGTYENDEEKLVDELLNPGMIAFDIGANFGYYTFRMAKKVEPGGTIYAFEPTTWAYDKLLRNASLNPNITNIEYMKIALSDSTAEKELNIQSSYRIDNKNGNFIGKYKITSLDEFVRDNHFNKIDFIKMDVDGYEGKIIRGSQYVLKKYHPIILMEICPSMLEKNMDHVSDLIEILTSLGYKYWSTEKKEIYNLTYLCSSLSTNTSLMVVAMQNKKFDWI